MCRRPITAITAVDFSYARDLGCTIRQVARARSATAQVAATVGPMLVDLRSPLAWSRGTENMVILSGHYGGDVVFSGHGAGGHPDGGGGGERSAGAGARIAAGGDSVGAGEGERGV